MQQSTPKAHALVFCGSVPLSDSNGNEVWKELLVDEARAGEATAYRRLKKGFLIILEK